MGAFAKIRHALSLMCVIYTIIISVMFAIGFAASDSASLFVPTPSKALLVLLFSAILGFASLILKKEGTGAVRVVIHYAICLAAFVITFVVGGGFSIAGGTSVMAVMIFTVVYAVVMGIRAVFCRRQSRQTAEVAEYTSLFK